MTCFWCFLFIFRLQNPLVNFNLSGGFFVSIKYQEFRKDKKWLVIWRNPWTGSRRQMAFEDEEKAIQFEQTQTELAQKEKELMKKARTKKKKNTQITIRELMNLYFENSESSEMTIHQLKYHANQFLSVFGDRKAAKIEKEDIFNFSAAQKLRGLCQATINRRVSILKTSLNWAVRNGLLETSPLANLQMPKAKSRRIAPPTPKEAQAMLKAAYPHVQRIIMIGICAGPRIGPSELFRLEWKDVDLDNAMMRMPNARKNTPNESRDIPIHPNLLPSMIQWYKQDSEKGMPYVIHYGGKQVKNIQHSWRKMLIKAGITRRIRPYDLRHAFATYALAGSADIGSVAAIMGHSDASMILKVYQHVQDTQKRAAVQSVKDILGLKGQKQIFGL